MSHLKKYSTVLLLTCSALLSAQQASKFQNTYGGSGYEHAYGVRQTFDNGYIIAGSTSSTGAGLTDGYLVKVDSLGLTQWSKCYGGAGIDVLRAVIELPDSGFVLAGYTNSAGHGGYDGWLIRTNKNGDTSWTKTIGTTDWDFFYGLDTLPNDSGFLLCGGTYGLGSGDEDYYVVKTNGSGDTTWTRPYGGNKQDEARSITWAASGNYAVTGTTMSLGDSLGDIWTLYMNTDGDTIWQRSSGLPGRADAGYDVINKSLFGSIFICGSITLSNGDMNGYMNEYLYNGTESGFEFDLGGSNIESFESVAHMPAGDLIFAGTTHSFGSGMGDIYFFRSGPWFTTTFGSLELDMGHCIAPTRDNGAIICGFTEGFNLNLSNMYLVKVDSTCASTPPFVLGVEEDPGAGMAVSVFPNPLSVSAQVLVRSREAVDASGLQFELYDLSGRLIPLNGEKFSSASAYVAQLQLERGGLAAGCYLYRLVSEGRLLQTGKLIVSDR